MTLTVKQEKKEAIGLFRKDWDKELREIRYSYRAKVKKIKNDNLPAAQLQQAVEEALEEFIIELKAQNQFYEETMKEIDHDFSC